MPRVCQAVFFGHGVVSVGVSVSPCFHLVPCSRYCSEGVLLIGSLSGLIADEGSYFSVNSGTFSSPVTKATDPSQLLPSALHNLGTGLGCVPLTYSG